MMDSRGLLFPACLYAGWHTGTAGPCLSVTESHNTMDFLLAVHRILSCAGFCAVLAIGWLATGCAVAPPQPVLTGTGAPWPLEGGTSGRTRQAAEPLAPPLQLVREIAIPDSGEFVSPITYAQGHVYADTEASLHVFAATADTVAWDIQLPGFFLSPLVAEDRLFVRAEAGDEGFLFALDALTGHKLWQFQFPHVGSEFQNVGGHVTSPVLDRDRLLVASGQVFYALHPETGAVAWELPLQEPVTSSAAAADGVAYIADFTHTYAVDIATGSELWRFAGSELSLFFAPVIQDGRVFIGHGAELVALEAVGGKVLWRTGRGTAPVLPAGAAADRVFGKTTRALTAHAVLDGAELWRYETLNFVSMPCVAGEHLYTIVRLGPASQVVALDLQTGAEVWRSEPLPLARTAPVIAGGKLYVRSEKGAIMEFIPVPSANSG